ncbi:hypothetical protein [Bradyrhizobium sp. URHC0002]
MIPLAMLLFLIGAVLAGSLRVWILVPFVFITAVVSGVASLLAGASLAVTIAFIFVSVLAPQLGYVAGLFAWHVLKKLTSALRRTPSRSLSVSFLYKRHSADQRY